MMLLFRELKIMLRSPAGAIQSLMFAVLVIALFPLAITPDPDQLEPLGIGLIWVVTLLSCLLAADKSLASDYADGSLEQMVLSDYPLWWVCLVPGGSGRNQPLSNRCCASFSYRFSARSEPHTPGWVTARLFHPTVRWSPTRSATSYGSVIWIA